MKRLKDYLKKKKRELLIIHKRKKNIYKLYWNFYYSIMKIT